MVTDMVGKGIAGAGDSEINELKRRLRLLEDQHRMLTYAVVASALGVEMGTKKHESLRMALGTGREIRVTVTLDEHAWPLVDYSVVPRLPEDLESRKLESVE